jgi:XTP/dITP diphosphohydrolase
MYREICFATGNRHKYAEAEAIARERGVILKQCPGVKREIQSDSLEEVAKHAALTAYMELGVPVLVEDAGLFIKALNGFPGPYSSYVYKTIGYAGLLKLMEGVEDRSACFKSVAVLVYEPFLITGVGEVCGTVAYEARGVEGFGFDPVFIPDGYDKTFAEMSVEEKNRVSHRARALRSVFKTLGEYLGAPE